MNVFQTHAAIVEDYATYIRSFLQIADQNIRSVVEQALDKGTLWPEALLQFNPSFEMFGSVADVTAKGLLHPDLKHIFKGYSLYRHQTEAIGLGTAGRDFIVTSGTGSGKSLTYLGTVFHYLLSNPNAKGVGRFSRPRPYLTSLGIFPFKTADRPYSSWMSGNPKSSTSLFML